MYSNQIVYPQGTKEITLSANESIAVYTQGKCQVLRQLGYPNMPSSLSLLGTVNNGETVFGPYASGATIVLQAGANEVGYETGLDPVVLSQRTAARQGAPGALNATGALTAAMIAAGIVTSTTAAAVAGTLPTGAVMDTELEGMQIGTSFDWSVITTGANAFTVTAAASGHTVVGNMVVAAGKAGLFRTRKTAAATYVTYSLANT
jgi:hypothetical protein